MPLVVVGAIVNRPRYPVFVSSTFRDLREERQAVLDAILELDHFPAGMEVFPAANETPWQLIERIIQQSDYYILIVGGLYGSTEENGISYTEKEYEYARKLNKPVLAFLHSHPEQIPAGKYELDPIDCCITNATVHSKLQFSFLNEGS